MSGIAADWGAVNPLVDATGGGKKWASGADGLKAPTEASVVLGAVSDDMGRPMRRPVCMSKQVSRIAL